MNELPDELQALVESLELLDRGDRIEMLIGLADGYREVPPEVAERPFGEEHRVPACESEAFVWVEEAPGGRLDLYFAVENPQGISAMALAAILDRTLSGLPAEEIARLPADVVYRIFGRELSMGKSMGLMGMVTMIQTEAKRRLAPA